MSLTTSEHPDGGWVVTGPIVELNELYHLLNELKNTDHIDYYTNGDSHIYWKDGTEEHRYSKSRES